MNSREVWLQTGYALMALEGPGSLKVEAIARQSGISKSSFYHHFADMEGFVEKLCQLHLDRCNTIAAKERMARRIDPELVEILLEHKMDLCFNRQLRFHRGHTYYAAIVQKSDAITGTDFVTLWMQELALPWSKQQAIGIFTLALDNFYLRMHPDTFDRAWMSAYFQDLKALFISMKTA